MKKFAQLTQEQRYKIDALQKTNPSIKQKEIAERLGVHPSTISRELGRNSKRRAGYDAKGAQFNTSLRRFRKPHKIEGELETLIITQLTDEWSPEQIAGRLKADQKELTVSHETIYNYIYRKQKHGSTLYQKLRRKPKKRRKRLKREDNRGKIPNKVMIDKRPQIVETKDRIGDWEGDTIIGKDHQSAMLTLVERKSKFTIIIPLAAKKAIEVEEKILNLLPNIPIPVHTITFDNGTEFTNHVNIAQGVNCQVYFAFPYHSWERGLNENTNGLIRQYIPKKTDFNDFSDEYVRNVQNKLNNRPRKTLGFLSPIEYLNNYLNCI